MADAGGVVYLLSSYQSGKGEVGAWRGERGGEGEIQEGRRQADETGENTLFQWRQQLYL